MKHTAIEWLSNQAYELFEQYSEGKFDRIQLNKLMVDATNKAKEMEKEQIVTAWMATDNELQRIAAEQYYNAIYGQEDDWTEQKFYDLLPDICLIEDTTNENTNNQRCMGYNACKKCFNNFRNSVIIKNK